MKQGQTFSNCLLIGSCLNVFVNNFKKKIKTLTDYFVKFELPKKNEPKTYAFSNQHNTEVFRMISKIFDRFSILNGRIEVAQ
jgi:hypothetical protein